MRPPYMTAMRSESDQQLLEVLADDQDAAAPRAQRQELLVDEPVAPMSRPRVGCAAISTFGSNASSRASSAFCRLPPDSVPARAFGPGQRMSKASICSSAKARMAPGLSRPSRLKAGVADARQHHAVGERQVGHQPGRHAVFRDAADAERLHSRGEIARDLLAGDRHRCRRRARACPRSRRPARAGRCRRRRRCRRSRRRARRATRRASGMPAWRDVEIAVERQHGAPGVDGSPGRRHDLVAAHQPRHLGRRRSFGGRRRHGRRRARAAARRSDG